MGVLAAVDDGDAFLQGCRDVGACSARRPRQKGIGRELFAVSSVSALISLGNRTSLQNDGS